MRHAGEKQAVTRRLPPLSFAAGACVVVVAALFNAVNLVFSIPRDRWSDFQEYYVAAQLGLRQGWGAVYDMHVYVPALLRAGGQPDTMPSTLLQAWVAIPFTVLPLRPAFEIWSCLLVLVLVGAWWIVTSGPLPRRVLLLCAAFGTDPLWFALLNGQVLVLVFSGVAAAVGLVERRRDVLAGLALCAIFFKPQDAVLVPFALLLVGRWRPVAIWAAFGLLLAILTLSLVGTAGILHWRQSVDYELARPFIRRYSMQEHLPALLAWPAKAAVLGAVGLAVRRRRESVPAVVAAAVLGSLLITPYLNRQDLEMLVLCAWITLPTSSWLGRVGLVAGYPLLMLAGTVGPIPILFGEAVWLSALATGWTEHASDRLRPVASRLHLSLSLPWRRTTPLEA